MCLWINENSQEIIEEHKKRGKPILGYKVLVKRATGNPNILYYSIWRDKEWKKNKTNVYVSDRKTSNLTKKEIESQKVLKGFHFYRTRKIARRCKALGETIIQFEIGPKDLVAFGGHGWTSNSTQFVATRCKMIKEVR